MSTKSGFTVYTETEICQKWSQFCSSLLFIATKIVCKTLKVCSYPEGGKPSVDQTPPFISLSHPLDSASIPLYPSALKLYITLRQTIQARRWEGNWRVLGTQHIEADWCLSEAERIEGSGLRTFPNIPKVYDNIYYLS